MPVHDEHVNEWTQEKYRQASTAFDDAVARPPALMKNGQCVDLTEFWLERNRVRSVLWRRMRCARYKDYMENLKLAESLEYRQGERGLLDRLTLEHIQLLWFTLNDVDEIMNKMRAIQ